MNRQKKIPRLDSSSNMNRQIPQQRSPQSIYAPENFSTRVKSDLFDNTPTLMLLKLHKYFNWADKKMHTVFFIENKDQISDDLLVDFKEGSELQVNPNLIAKKENSVTKDEQPKGLVMKEETFFSNPSLLHKGGKKEKK